MWALGLKKGEKEMVSYKKLRIGQKKKYVIGRWYKEKRKYQKKIIMKKPTIN